MSNWAIMFFWILPLSRFLYEQISNRKQRKKSGNIHVPAEQNHKGDLLSEICSSKFLLTFQLFTLKVTNFGWLANYSILYLREVLDHIIYIYIKGVKSQIVEDSHLKRALVFKFQLHSRFQGLEHFGGSKWNDQILIKAPKHTRFF